MLYIPKYYFNIITTSLRATFKGFIPDKGSLVKSIFTTAVFWLILVFAKTPMTDRITEAAALALAIVLTFIFYGLLDLIATPAREDQKKSREIQTLSSDLRSHTDRVGLQKYFVSFANEFKSLEQKLSDGTLGADEFLVKVKEGYDIIEKDISERPDKDFIKYRIYDDSAANTLAPSMVPMMASNLVGKLNIEKDTATRISEYLWYRQNLDGPINVLSS